MLCGFINKIFRNYRYNSENSIDIENLKIILKNDKNSILIDVRSPQEYKESHLDNSINIPLYDISKKISYYVKNKDNIIITYCQTGNRSIRAIKILSKMGYKNLYNLKGGLDNI